jgi:DNA-binding response OmpR family regulator
MKKPFSMEELIVRLKALVRRKSGGGGRLPENTLEEINIGKASSIIKSSSFIVMKTPVIFRNVRPICYSYSSNIKTTCWKEKQP